MSEYGDVDVLGWQLGGLLLEAELHQKFQQYNTYREWFEPVNEIFDYIEENAFNFDFNFIFYQFALIAKENQQLRAMVVALKTS